MPLKPDKATVGATVSTEMRDRIKRFAEMKHWSVAQSLGLFIEAYWERWEQENGVEHQEPPVSPKPQEPAKPSQKDKRKAQ
jgi:hypothetical protein